VAKTQKCFTPNQGDFFQQLDSSPFFDNAHDLDIGPELSGALNTAIRQARKMGRGRDHIVERMNQCLPDNDKPITLRQLNAWTAKSKEYHEIPARYIPAFCWSTESVLPLLALCHAMGLDTVDQRDQMVMQLGRNIIETAQLTRQNKLIRNRLGD